MRNVGVGLVTGALSLGLASTAAAEEGAPPDVSARVVATLGPSVVRLSLRHRGKQQASGSGFFVREDGVVVTNVHVIHDVTDTIVAILPDGRQLAVLGTLAIDEPHDLALLRVERGTYPALALAPSASIHVGEPLFSVSSPLGFDQSAASGTLAALRPDFPEDQRQDMKAAHMETTGPLVQHTVPTTHGSSGSPLVDEQGRVVAVVFAGFDGTLVGFAAHVDSLRALIGRTDLDAKPTPLGPDLRTNLYISGALLAALVVGLATLSLRRRMRIRKKTLARRSAPPPMAS